MRPMFLEFPSEEYLFNTATQFMFGDNILVSPKLVQPISKSTRFVVDEAPVTWAVKTELP